MATAEQLVATRVPTPLKDILDPSPLSRASSSGSRMPSICRMHWPARREIMTRRSSTVGPTITRAASRCCRFTSMAAQRLSPRQQNFMLLPGLPDLSEFEYVEVLRGADALFTGNANPGGTVSLVRKRPRSTYQSTASFTVGSWSSRRAEIDVTGPIAMDGALRGRADAVYWSRRLFLPTRPTRSQAGLRRAGMGFLPEYHPDRRRQLSVGRRDSRLRRPASLHRWHAFQSAARDQSGARMGNRSERTREAYVQYRQNIADAWSLKVNVASWRIAHTQAFANFAPIDPISGVAGPPTGSFTENPALHRQNTADVTLVGTLDWFGMREQIAVGGDFTRFSVDIDFASTGPLGPPIQDYRQFDRRAYSDPRLLRTNAFRLAYGVSLKQYGGFASLQVDVNPALSVMGGMRISSNQAHLGSESLGGALIHGDSGVINPYGGVIYRINDRFSWYASYAAMYLTTEVKNERVGGGLIGPERAGNLETGIKGAWRDGALNGSLALYRIAQRDVPATSSTCRTIRRVPIVVSRAGQRAVMAPKSN